MSEGPLLALCGLCLIALALWMVRKQARAATCARHDARAGQLAMLLAAACLITGLALLTLALAA